MRHLYLLIITLFILTCSSLCRAQLIVTTPSNSTSSCNGSMSFPSSGNYNTAVYSWNWYQGAYFPGAVPISSNDTMLSGLCVGSYSFLLDSLGTTIVNENVVINDLCGQMSSAGTTYTFCDPDSCNGSINFVISGATPPYTYSWSTGATTPTVSGLCPGMCTVVCTDSYGCYLTYAVEIGIEYPAVFEGYVNYAHDYTSDCSGSATAYVFNGVAPYSYAWSTGDTTDFIDSLCAGVYSVSIWDATNTDTLYYDFVIADSSTLYGNNPYPNVPVLDTLYANLLANCIIDYTDIDSATLHYAAYDSVYQNLYITWAVYSPTDTVYINDTLGLAGLQGLYMLTISVYCPNKSANDFFAIEGFVYFTGSGISTLQVNENPLESVSVYPNPFHDVIKIDNPDGAIQSVKLIDLNGRVLAERASVDSGVIEFGELESLSRGTYLLILSGDKHSKTYKLIK